MNLTIVSAVNDEDVLRSCLLKSPDLEFCPEFVLRRGFSSAADAFNPIIEASTNDVLVFAHQDVFLPAGWLTRLKYTIESLCVTDSNWAVLGTLGVTSMGVYVGQVYCTANRGMLGHALRLPTMVNSLDELVLVLRKSSGVRFDRGTGFHFYGTDVCLNARRSGQNTYVIPALCIHNSDSYGMFPFAFWRGYYYMRNKWSDFLPVRTTCIEICRPILPVLLNSVKRFFWRWGKWGRQRCRVDDPAELWQRLQPQLLRNEDGQDNCESMRIKKV